MSTAVRDKRDKREGMGEGIKGRVSVRFLGLSFAGTNSVVVTVAMVMVMMAVVRFLFPVGTISMAIKENKRHCDGE